MPGSATSKKNVSASSGKSTRTTLSISSLPGIVNLGGLTSGTPMLPANVQQACRKHRVGGRRLNEVDSAAATQHEPAGGGRGKGRG